MQSFNSVPYWIFGIVEIEFLRTLMRSMSIKFSQYVGLMMGLSHMNQKNLTVLDVPTVFWKQKGWNLQEW